MTWNREAWDAFTADARVVESRYEALSVRNRDRGVAIMTRLDRNLPRDWSAFHLAHNWHLGARHFGAACGSPIVGKECEVSRQLRRHSRLSSRLYQRREREIKRLRAQRGL